ncbi:MAG: InlB B-repeat-containing protein, partial [Candidatus Gallimonas sp.]
KVTPTAYQVAFDANGGSSEPAYLRAAINGETGKATVNAADLPVPVRPGYEFLGWTDEDGKVFESAEIDCSILLTAKWDKLPNGALVSFDGEGERKTTVVYKPNGAALGELPEATKLGFTFLGWYYTDGGEEIRATEQSVFAEANYNGDTKEITLCPKWARETGVNSTDVTLKLEKGRYTEEADYDGYVAYTAGVSSFTTFDGITLDEGRFSAYVKFPTSGSNGIILGATIADDFGTNCDANYMLAGSSYYYWHFNAASGVWQFAKVTNAGNEESQNASSRGYDVLASGTVAGYVPGGRYLLTVETYNVPQGKRFDLYLNGTLVQSASDTENVGGAALTGTALGFRNAGGGATYYGIEILPVAQMENVVTLTLSDGESTQEYVRAAGWETNLPVMSKTGYVFVGWTREEGKADTMFADSVVTEEMDGWTLYAYYLTETQALIYFDPAGGTYDKAFAVVEKGVLETDFGAASGRPGYVFDGWYDENGVKVCAGYEVTETVSVHAEYLPAVADAGEIVFSINDKVTSENDGIYDLYTISDATIGKFDKTLESGTLSLYVQYNSTSGKGGILFGATGLENLNSSAMTNASANYYYWYVNAASGGWILYKVVNGSSTNLNDQVKGTGTAWKAGTFSKNTVYRFNVTMEKGADGSLTITLSVTAGDTDYAYITYTDTAPHTGTQIGYLNNTNGTSSSFYGLGVLSVEEMQKETLTLNAGAGATENGATQITVPMGWKFTLPGATRTDYTFLG